MDVDRIQQEMDVKTLQNNIMHVTFCNIEAELVSYKIDQVGIHFFSHAILRVFKGRNKDWFLLYYNYYKYCLTQANVTIMH